jgi:hypothetical protein
VKETRHNMLISYDLYELSTVNPEIADQWFSRAGRRRE